MAGLAALAGLAGPLMEMGGKMGVGGAAQLGSSGLQAGVGLYQAWKGAKEKRIAEGQEIGAMTGIKSQRYADYNQGYYDELQRRSNVGLQQEQLGAMQQGADRAAGVGLQTTGDRRGGLMGIGQAQTSLSDAYRNIGLADVAQRESNSLAALQEQLNRGVQTQGEQTRNFEMDLSLASRNRGEAIQKQQAGTQNVFGAAQNLATFYGGNGDEGEDIFGEDNGKRQHSK
jgi:hypothetical protein